MWLALTLLVLLDGVVLGLAYWAWGVWESGEWIDPPSCAFVQMGLFDE